MLKMRWSLVLACVTALLMVATVSGQGGEDGRPRGERPGQGGGPAGDRGEGGPRPDRPTGPTTCNLDAEKRLSEEEKEQLEAFLGGDFTLTKQIVPLLRKVTRQCREALRKIFEKGADENDSDEGSSDSGESGDGKGRPSCDVDTVKEIICDPASTPDVFIPLLRCLLNQDGNKCTVVKKLYDEVEDCSTDTSAVLKLLNNLNCEVSGSDVIERLADLIKLPAPQLQRILDGLDADKFKDFLINLRNYMDEDRSMSRCFPCDGIQTIVKAAVTKLNLATMLQGAEGFKTFLEEAGGLLPYLDKDTCEKIDIAAFKGILADKSLNFKDLDFECASQDSCKPSREPKTPKESSPSRRKRAPEPKDGAKNGKGPQDGNCQRDCGFTCGKILAKKLIQSINCETEASILPKRLSECLPLKYQCVQPGKCSEVPTSLLGGDCKSKDPSSQASARKAAEQCRPQVDPQDITVENITSIGCPFLYMPTKFLKNIPDDVKCEAVCELSECFATGVGNPSIVRHLAETCTSVNETCFGSAILYKPLSAGTLDAKQLKQRLDALRENDNDRGNQKMARDLADMARSTEIADNEPLARTLASETLLKKMKDEGISLKEFVENAERSKLGLTQGQRRKIIRKYMNETDKEPSDLSLDDIQKIKDMLKAFIKKEVKEAIRGAKEGEEGERPSKWEAAVAACTSGIDSTMVQSEVTATEFADAAEKEIGLENIVTSDIENVDRVCLKELIKKATGDEFRNIRTEMCKRVGQTLLASNNLDANQELLNACMKCNKSKETEDADDLFGDEESDECGQNLGWLNNFHKDYSNFTAEEVFDMACYLDPRLMYRPAIPQVVDKLCEYLDDADETEMEQIQCNNWIVRLYQKTCIANLEDPAPRKRPLSKEEQTARDRLIDEQKPEDRIQSENDEEDVIKEIIESIQTQSSRKKRSIVDRVIRETSTPLTCIKVVSLGEEIKYLSSDDIEDMDNDEFDECITDFGQTVSLSEDSEEAKNVRDAILDKIKQTQNICDFEFTMEDIRDLGYIAKSLTPDDIKCLKNFQGESTLAFKPIWSEDQLEAFAKLFLSSNNLPGTESLQSDHIGQLGHFICGFTSEEIDRIKQNEFNSALKMVGNLEICPSDPLRALAVKAKLFYTKELKDYDVGEFSDLGILLGGFTKEDIEQVHNLEDKVDGWAITAIKHLSPGALDGIKPDAFQNFSPEQARAFSPTQRDGMTDAQNKAVCLALDHSNDDCSQYDSTGPKNDDGKEPGDGTSGAAIKSAGIAFFSILLCLLI